MSGIWEKNESFILAVLSMWKMSATESRPTANIFERKSESINIACLELFTAEFDLGSLETKPMSNSEGPLRTRVRLTTTQTSNLLGGHTMIEPADNQQYGGNCQVRVQSLFIAATTTIKFKMKILYFLIRINNKVRWLRAIYAELFQRRVLAICIPNLMYLCTKILDQQSSNKPNKTAKKILFCSISTVKFTKAIAFMFSEVLEPILPK